MTYVDKLASIVGVENVITEPEELARLSSDYSWFSPVLVEELAGLTADVAVAPTDIQQLREVIATAVADEIPVTLRGGGTGNYGQAVPFRRGILVLTHKLDGIVIVDGSAHVDAGARLLAIDRAARKSGYELRIFPSTVASSSAAGFIAGGTGGIGSIQWGVLRDDNVESVSIVSLDDAATVSEVAGDDLGGVIHAYGTTGVITRLSIPLAPVTSWRQLVFSFSSLLAAQSFGHEMALLDCPLRLISIHEWPLPVHYRPLLRRVDVSKGDTVALLIVAADAVDAIETLAARQGGILSWTDADEGGQALQLGNYSFNHSTLWAKKGDPDLTYFQTGHSFEHTAEQIQELKRQFGEDYLVHLEYMRRDGMLMPASIPLVRYRGPDSLDRYRSAMGEVGMRVIDPHTPLLDAAQADGAVARLKRLHDRKMLLNPGKLIGMTMDDQK